jgi:hypothetical protein
MPTHGFNKYTTQPHPGEPWETNLRSVPTHGLKLGMQLMRVLIQPVG